MQAQTAAAGRELAAKLAGLLAPTSDTPEVLLASASYDGDRKLALLKFYDPKAGRFWIWRDNTGHRPYCYTRLPMDELSEIRSRKDVVDIVEEERVDLLNDSTAKVRKIITTDPLAVGGGNDSIRDKIKAWEADIKYYENFTYDRGLQMGTYYRVASGTVEPVRYEVPEVVASSLEAIARKNPKEFQPYLAAWAELLGAPLCDFRRIALDIEVANEEGRVPDPENPRQQVIAVSFYNEQERVVYLLKKGKDVDETLDAPFATEVFDREADLIRAVMSKIMDYPFVVTFNGDDFDLRYLKHRAEGLGIGEDEDPIQLERVAATLKHGVHIDLYQFFKNRSIQVYAFGNKYTEHTLNGIAEALLGESKVEFDGEISDLPLAKLAEYCLHDSELTYKFTTMSGGVVMKLLLVISRIGRMPMNDVSRLGVSNWIRSMLFFEHRKIGAIIPRQDELSAKGEATSQAAIKGKKYKGGLVIEPKQGAFFDVSVLDFASLYPSLIKVKNLSYETVNCPHEECRANRVPDTDSWVCTKRKGIVSLVTGSLRDLRVAHYKPLTKNSALTADDRGLNTVVTQGLKVFLNACFTGDTFVVTLRGPKNIKDFVPGDLVVNVNPETLVPEVDKVVEVQEFDFNGDLYHFSNNRFVDLMVTPNHKFLVEDKRKTSESGALFRTADEIYGLTNISIPRLRGAAVDRRAPDRVSLLETAKAVGAGVSFYPSKGTRLINWFRTLPLPLQQKIRQRGSVKQYWNRRKQELESHYLVSAQYVDEADVDAAEAAGGRAMLSTYRGTKIPARFDALMFASFCGWYVSEGSPFSTAPRRYSNGHYRGRAAGVSITQSYGKGNSMGIPYRAEIRQTIADLGLSGRTDLNDAVYFKVSSSVLYAWVLANCYDSEATRHNASTKRVPGFVFQSRLTMQSFFDSAYKGDGSRRNRRYTTKSLGLAHDMVVILSYLGANTKVKFEEGVYRVVYRRSSSKLAMAGKDRHRHVAKVKHEGKVYCVTTERNHTVIAGRNGKFVPVGQSYGVLGFETFAFYCLPVAEATAALGRDAITRTIQKCKALGIEVLYSDTDSLFLRNPSKSQISDVTSWADADLGVELDLDKVYRYVAFSSRKKNYFGVLPDGTVDIRGLTGKKSQTPEYLKETFYKALDILRSVQTQEDFDAAKARTKDLLAAMIRDLKERRVPVEKLAFNVMMSKPTGKYDGTTPQHVRAAKLLEETGKETKAGEIIAFVKTKSPPYVKPVSMAKVEDVDSDKYVEYAHSMFDQMLDALDFSFDELMGGTTLDLFWSS